jgi:hypothetical protein
VKVSVLVGHRFCLILDQSNANHKLSSQNTNNVLRLLEIRNENDYCVWFRSPHFGNSWWAVKVSVLVGHRFCLILDNYLSLELVRWVEEIMAKEFCLIIWLASNHDNYSWSATIINHGRTNFCHVMIDFSHGMILISHANFNFSHISFHVFM